MADLGSGRLDHEPTGRLGGSSTRRSRDRRAAMDLPFAEGPEGPLRSDQFRLLGDLEILSETRRGAELAAVRPGERQPRLLNQNRQAILPIHEGSDRLRRKRDRRVYAHLALSKVEVHCTLPAIICCTR